MRLPHARPQWQVRLERIAYWLCIVLSIACLFVAFTAVDPEIASSQLP